MGILYGTQVGKRVELRTSFELVYKNGSNGVEIDKEYVDKKIKDYAQVYKGYELLGWYGTGNTLTPADLAIHKQILSLNLNDSPLFLLCGTNLTNVDDLPISIYEASMAMEEQQEKMSWASVPYFIETELSEQISVDNIIRATTSTKQSELVLHYAKLKKAIEILKSKVDILRQYVEAVKSGKVERDEGILRTIKGLTHRFPSIESPTFTEEYNNELNEVLMITQLAAITKGTKNLNELIERWNFVFYSDKRARFS
mmetsp:Transcript_10954/g.40807  ORF Transcript_10954/g.40807 Transcript_10954/m.40807 type:complete len:256 (-) Transcript_10954:111-878(-)